MTGDLPGPDQRAAQQTYEAAVRLDEQAATELDRAAAHCRVAATHFRGAEVPGGRRTPGRRWGISARQNCGWRNRLVPTASRRASRACVEDHLRPVTGGTDGSRCRRLGSPQSSREVPAETQEEPAGTGRGTGTQRTDRCSGGSETSGGVAGNRGAGLAAGGAGQGRGRPPPATRRHLCPGPLRHGRSGPGLSRPGTLIGRPSPNQPAAVVHPRSVKGKLAALVPSGPLTLGGWCARRSSRARASCWPAGLC
jgi:hypothetical protein